MAKRGDMDMARRNGQPAARGHAAGREQRAECVRRRAGRGVNGGQELLLRHLHRRGHCAARRHLRPRLPAGPTTLRQHRHQEGLSAATTHENSLKASWNPTQVLHR